MKYETDSTIRFSNIRKLFCILFALKISLISTGAAAALLKAEFVDETTVSIKFEDAGTNELPLAGQIQIFDHIDTAIKIQSLNRQSTALQIKLEESISPFKNYFLQINNQKHWIKLSHKLINQSYSPVQEKLGVSIDNDDSAVFKLWSPPSTEVTLILYSKTNQQDKIYEKALSKNMMGLWTTTVKPDEIGVSKMDGLFYQYRITAYGQTTIGLDPYALSMASFDPNSDEKVGKGAIIDLNSSSIKINEPIVKFSNANKMKNKSDFIGYEMHIRDFTISPDSDVSDQQRGTYLGYIEKIPHLKDLGITHLQLMPIHNFYTVNEDDRSFQGADASNINYNWGYDPHNYFTLEGWFSSNARDPYARMREFRKLVNRLHKANIGVTLDVVYNHTFNTSIFENICPGCYYRKDANGNISNATGAGPTVESRNPMVRKLIIESLTFMKDFYGINGFRFDLMGFIDTTTMTQARQALGEDSILYGEGWLLSDIPQNQAVTKENLPHNLEITAFSDGVRDSISGRLDEGGFVTGLRNNKPRLGSSVIGGLKRNLYFDSDYLLVGDNYNRFTESPFESLNFISIHDGPTLWDKINVSLSLQNKNNSLEERMQRSKLAAATLFTTIGRVVVHGGVEIARTKPLANNDPEKARVIPHNRGQRQRVAVGQDPDIPETYFFHENSYKSSDYTNMVRWDRKDSPEFSPLFTYYKKLISFRRKANIFNIDIAQKVQKDVDLLQTDDSLTLAYTIKSDAGPYKEFIVIHNASEQTFSLNNYPVSKTCSSVLLDQNDIRFYGLKSTDVTIENGRILVPRVSSAVVAISC